MEYESFAAALIDGYPRQVAGHQIGGELHARELQSQGLGQRMCQSGLAHARHVLDQQVAASEQTGDAILHLRRLAHDHRVKLIEHRFEFDMCLHG